MVVARPKQRNTMFERLIFKRPMLQAVVALLLVGGLTFGASPAQAFELQLEDYWAWSYFQVTEDNVPVGSVAREKWRQPFRRSYQSYDALGEPVAASHQIGVLEGRVVAANLAFRFRDHAGHLLGEMRGSLFTLHAGSYVLENALGKTVAQITLDRHAQTVAIRHPYLWPKVYGRMTRIQQATGGRDSWVVTLPGDEVDVDDRVWPLIAAFFADAWRGLSRSQEEG